MSLEDRLSTFASANNYTGKGALSLALVITRRAIKDGMPLYEKNLLTKAGGQVSGLGKSAVQNILANYGIKQVLANEGGRTNRGNIERMRKYVSFLNALQKTNAFDLKIVERWWVKRIDAHFSSKPLKLKLDRSRSLRAIISDLLDQVLKRQRESPGATYMGTVLQHLVGAKLELICPPGSVDHHGASVADAPTDRDGDFTIKDTAIHVTTAPTEALIQKCGRNIEAGKRPIIVTTQLGAQGAQASAMAAGIDGRIDIFEIEQFIATNVYERSAFVESKRRAVLIDIVDRYNSIVAKHESDPSLKIEIAR